MGRHGSRRPSINTSADAVLRRLDREFDVEPSGVRELARAHVRRLAVAAIGTGALLVVAALLAPAAVVVVGCGLTAMGVAMATLIEDEDRETGITRTRRWCRRRARRATGRLTAVRRRRRGGRREQEPSAPIGCRVAPWLFPDPRRSRR